jgi:queuine tRNA-ribosyltransferase
MIDFSITKKSKRSRARLGLLKTPHDVVQTPTLVPVATQAVVKTLHSAEAERTKTQMVIANTFHLHLKPGEAFVKRAKGLHNFMQWQHPIMTDSAGYQVFSLGFGKDLQQGKIVKRSMQKESASDSARVSLDQKAQPKEVTITDRGVWFRSPLDNSKLFIGPRESIKIQEQLGADIMLAFDECTAPSAGLAYTKKSLERTHAWARECLAARRSKQALYGIVQGGKYKALRIESARFVGALPFDGFAIGGEFGNEKKTMTDMLRWVLTELPEEKPRHLLGIGHLDDIPRIIKEGVDTFDCIVPTHYARRGFAFTSSGKLDLYKRSFLRSHVPLDRRCRCFVCGTYTRSYVSHLFRAREITAMSLVTFHNLFFFNSFVEKIRQDIARGKV